MRLPQSWSLSGAQGMLVAAGLGMRGEPSAAGVRRPAPRPRVLLPSELTPSQRRAIADPLRAGRPGRVRWDGQDVRTSSAVTCASLVLTVAAAAADPVVAAWLVTGRLLAPTAPGILRRVSREGLRQPTVTLRLAAAERAVHDLARSGGLGPLPWPRALGTPPWGAAAALRFRDVELTHTPVNDRDVARTRRVLEVVRASTDLGICLPLYTGGDASNGLAAAFPRHVVLAVPAPRAPAGELRIFEPSRGRTYAVATEALLARSRPHAALGGWSHVCWALLPRDAFSATP